MADDDNKPAEDTSDEESTEEESTGETSEQETSEDEGSDDEASEDESDEPEQEPEEPEGHDDPPEVSDGGYGPDPDDPDKAPALYLAEFDTTKDVMHAAETVRDAGFTKWDVHTPFPVHGMDAAMGLPESKLGLLVFAAGATGLIGAYLMMLWMNGIDYPIIIGGKPGEAIPSMVPILFECTVLLSGITAVFGMLGLNKLPRHHHPIFFSKRFERGSDDKFFVSIEAGDPKFDLEKTRELLTSLHPTHLELVEESLP